MASSANTLVSSSVGKEASQSPRMDRFSHICIQKVLVAAIPGESDGREASHKSPLLSSSDNSRDSIGCNQKCYSVELSGTLPGVSV